MNSCIPRNVLFRGKCASIGIAELTRCTSTHLTIADPVWKRRSLEEVPCSRAGALSMEANSRKDDVEPVMSTVPEKMATVFQLSPLGNWLSTVTLGN